MMVRSAMYGTVFWAVPTLLAAQQAQSPLAPLPPALPLKHTAEPTTTDITARDLKTRLYIFADDSMRGRMVGRYANAMGTSYIAAECKRMGLLPAGDNGTYFQALPQFPLVLIDNKASLKVGGKALQLTKDYIPVGKHGLDHKTLSVVYGGALNAPTISEDQAAGKLVVFSMSTTDSLEAISLPTMAAKAAAVGVIALDDIPAQKHVAVTYGNLNTTAELTKPVILLSKSAAQTMFGASMPLKAGAKGRTVTTTFDFISSARNVVAIIPGSDPVLKNEYVAIGAHNDHIGRGANAGEHDSLRVLLHYASIRGAETNGVNVTPSEDVMSAINADIAKLRKQDPQRQDSIYNGADDDGSGSVTLLEIAQHIAAMPVKPKRSMLLVWHTGEEAGMLGSGYFTGHPTVPIDSVVTQLNIDMIGRGEASDLPEGSPNYLMLVGARKLSTELGKIVDTVNANDKYKFTMDENDPADYYHRSDHYMYAARGIPVAFFSTGAHPDYHQVTDEPQYIHYDKMARIGQFVSDLAVYIGNRDHRPVVDQQPDQPQQ